MAVLSYESINCLCICNFNLQSFSDEALAKRQMRRWDLAYFVTSARDMMTNSAHVDDITMIMKGFEETVHPTLPLLKKSLIHFDSTELNIVVDNSQLGEYHFKSFIDFGDVLETCTIFDLAVTLSSLMVHQAASCSNIVEFVGPLISGYHSVLPLSEEELDCLYYLVLARSCLIALNSEIFYKAEPWNDYIHINISKSWHLVHILLGTSKQEVDRTWKNFLSEFSYKSASF